MIYANIEVIGVINVLNEISKKKLPQKINFAIMKNLLIFQKEYEVYVKSLQKLLEQYKDYILLDENGKQMQTSNGLPLVQDEVRQEFEKEISELLNIKIDIPVYYVSDELFNYDETDGRYDIMTAQELITLQSIICKN